LKTLVLLTSEFPYGKGETFLENEYPFLKDNFSQIYFVTEKSSESSRIKSEDDRTFFIDKPRFLERISSLLNLFFWIEIRNLLKKKKLTIYTFRTALYSISKAILIRNLILRSKNLKNLEESIFYSYWMDEKALALTLLKNKSQQLICITRVHGWDVYQDRHRENYLPFRSFILNNMNQTFSISQNGKEYLATKYFQNKYKIKVSRLGAMALQSIPQKKENNTFHVLSISSIISLKRVDKIMNVLSHIPDMKIDWTHIGSGPLQEKLQGLAKEKKIQNPNFSFTFLGQKSNSGVRQFLSENYIDLFINLSETEGIPVSIMEAQSARIPVLASSVGGTPEIVNNENGILVEKDESDEVITQKIKDYFDLSEVEKQKKRERSYQNWKENYNAETNYNEFVKLLLSAEVSKAENNL
jgi:glycosyltransferase involved in cell wall biosynthesis